LIMSVQQLSDVQPMGLSKSDLLQELGGTEHYTWSRLMEPQVRN
jgi:hypothetical protein